MKKHKQNIKTELKVRTENKYCEWWYDDLVNYIDSLYSPIVNYDFSPLLKDKVTNIELQEFCKNNLQLEISPKRASQLFKDYLIANEIKHFRGNTSGVRYFQLQNTHKA